MSAKTVYRVTYTEEGKVREEPFADYLQAEARAKEKSRASRAPVLVESDARYIHARWEAGQQTLARSITLIAGASL